MLAAGFTLCLLGHRQCLTLFLQPLLPIRQFLQRFAIIDQLELRFDGSLATFTGETGAGKSILLGALSLLLGKRADTSVLADSAASCSSLSRSRRSTSGAGSGSGRSAARSAASSSSSGLSDGNSGLSVRMGVSQLLP